VKAAIVSIQIMIIWAICTTAIFGVPVIPWTRSMAAPGVIFLRVGGQEDMGGAMVHELCHIQQMREGKHKTVSVRTLELECSCAEYFYYERIHYQAGMDAVFHYDIH